MSDTENTNHDVELFRTTIKCQRENGAWKATEPAGEQDVWGRGDNPREAVKHYVEALE